ncbi:MAG TPA: hypothetical protein VGS80_08985 [Ktedonobacterales bacterium]|nr:hypothetical protein [Ktedonobacterales bacterium]
MEIWTSRFQNKALAAHPELVKVGITVGQPRWPLGYAYERLPLLAPYGLFRETDRSVFTVPLRLKAPALRHGEESRLARRRA